MCIRDRYHAPALATLAKKFPERQAFALSLHGTGGSLGETLGPLIFGSLLILVSCLCSLISLKY